MTVRREHLVSLLGLFVGLSVSGCATTRFVAPPEDALSDASLVLERAEAAAAARRAIVADVRASYYGPKGAAKAKMVLLVRRPADVHISLLTPTDDVLAVMAVFGERFVSFRRGSERCFIGESCPENLGRFSPVALSPRRLNHFLFADPIRVLKGSPQLAWDSSVGAYRILVDDGIGASQYLWISHGTWDVVRNTVFNGETIESEARYGDYTSIETQGGPVRVAQRVSLNVPARSIDLRLVFRGLELNIETGDSPYAVSCPEGAEPVALSCDGPDSHPRPSVQP